MKQMVIILLLSLITLNVCAQKNNGVSFSDFIFQEKITELPIIPIPQKVEIKENMFSLVQQTAILFEDQEFKNKYENYFLDFIKQQFDEIKPAVVKMNFKNQIIFRKAVDEKLPQEGYIINISNKKMMVSSSHHLGIWNAIQTLKQLILSAPNNLEGRGVFFIPECTIYDYPKFQWRGLMLDVSRHFFTKEEVKKYMDVMSLYKFNRFHWHLADDQGWRIDIKAFPKLTEVGAWRVERHGFFGIRPNPKPNESATYGGFYTQEDIKEIVQYASDRNITIVPELDIPGHSMAAIAAYPQLSVTQSPLMVSPGHKFANWFPNGKFEMLEDNTLDPTSDFVYDFLEKVLKEVSQLFPGEYIHIGGDECYHGFWERSDKCQKFMQANHISNVEGLQLYFINRVNKIIRSLGKKMIGWDEILDGGTLDKTSAVMNWRAAGVNGAKTSIGATASQDGYKVVMSPTTNCYLDYTQGDPSWETKIYSSLSLKKSYEFKAVPDSANADNILGGQANLWTEQVPTLQHAFYMTYPRAFSIVETLWSGEEKKNWSSFTKRVEAHFSLFEKEGHQIAQTIYEPMLMPYKIADTLFLKMSHELDGVKLYYTINNTFPDQKSPLYSEPFLIPEGKLNVRIQTYRHGKPIGRMLNMTREALLERIK